MSAMVSIRLVLFEGFFGTAIVGKGFLGVSQWNMTSHIWKYPVIMDS